MIQYLLWAMLIGALSLHLITAMLAAVRFLPGFRKQSAATGTPFLSLIRPVSGVDRFDRETLASSFDQDYPDYEIIFCAEREDDPAVALVRELIAEHPGRPARLLIGKDTIAVNPKINNLYKGYRDSKAELLAMVDSNLLLPPHFLRDLVGELREGVGMVSSPPVATRPQNFWGAVECAFMNANHLRFQLAADSLGFGFVHGKAVLFPRRVIEDGGGFEALGRDLGADVAMNKLARRQGLKVRYVRRPYAQPIGARSLPDAWGRQLRWTRVRRDGYPLVFLIEWIQGFVPPAVVLGVLILLGAVPVWSLGLLALIWYGAEFLLSWLGGWPHGPRDFLALLVRDLMLPLLWLAAWRTRSVSWRGNTVVPVKDLA